MLLRRLTSLIMPASPVASASADVVVLGAGPAGLAAAWKAGRRGLQVVVLERGAAVGGMAASLTVAGMRVDLGSHRLHPALAAPLLRDLRTLLGEDLQLRRRHARLRLAGRWVGYPLAPGELLRTLPRDVLLRLARDAATARLRRPRADTYEEVLRASAGPTAYDLVHGPWARKLWGLPGDQVDGEVARVRVSAEGPLRLAAGAVRPRRAEAGDQPRQGSSFWYPRRGFGQLSEVLADAAAGAGVRIVTAAEVERVQVRGDGVVVRTRDGREFEAGRALSTLPLPALARLASPGPPLTAVEAASRLRYRAMVLVYLVHGGGRWTEFDTHHLPGGETQVTRVSEPANYRDNDEDPVDRTVLCAEIPCAFGDEVWTSDDEGLAALVREGMLAAGLPPVRLAGVQVQRVRAAYPVFTTGYAASLHTLQEWVDSLPTVTALGQLGLFSHDRTHRALGMGYAAACALGQGGTWDDQTWRSERDRFAATLVGSAA